MEVNVQKKTVIASIHVIFNEADIEQIKKMIEENPHSNQGLFLRSILSKAGIESVKPKNSFWYVTVCGNAHTLADAIGTIRSLLPNYANGITKPANWFTEKEVCVGMWKEQDAKSIQKLLSDKGFETSLVKAGDQY